MSSYRLRYLITAPLIVVAGLTAVFWGRRAAAFGNTAKLWVDSLDHGSGPVRITVPMPIFISGTRVGNLDTVVVQRHVRKSMDSIRLVVKPLASAKLSEYETCALRVESFDRLDIDNYQQALACASDTSGLTRFGSISFESGQTVALYMDASEAACLAPANEDVDVAVKTEPVKVAVQAPGVNVAVNAGAVNVSVHQHGLSNQVSCRVHRAISGADIQRLSRDAQRMNRAQARQIGIDVRRAAEAARAAGEAARH